MPKSASNNPGEPTLITRDLLQQWPLPQPGDEGDKESRGRVLVVGGARSLPGAMVLAGTAALRAGAGKLQMATCESVALAIGVAVPEALVAGLPETEAGGIDPSAAAGLADRANMTGATLLGPGMVDSEAVRRLVQELLPRIEETVLILDAEAMVGAASAPGALRKLQGNVILTPHAGEMASMLDMDKVAVNDDPVGTVRRAAGEWQAVVALKGAETHIATPDGDIYRYHSGNIGLATSGSGDTLAGIIAGLAARGATPVQAAVWGVWLHGAAGNRLAETMGGLGYLARELLAEIPALMAGLANSAA